MITRREKIFLWVVQGVLTAASVVVFALIRQPGVFLGVVLLMWANNVGQDVQRRSR